MRSSKILLASVCLALPSTAMACDMHGFFGGLGGMTFSNMSISDGYESNGYNSANRSAANHATSRSVRHIRFGAGPASESVDDTSDAAEDYDESYDEQNPLDAATFR